MNDDEKVNELKKFRTQIDDIDDKILRLLSKRCDVVENVGKLKSDEVSQKSIIRPGREASMIRRIAYGDVTSSSFPRAAVAQVWRMIISGAINIEEKSHISVLAMQGNRECYWLSREYFGAFTPTTMRPTKMDVLHDVLNKNSTVGVLHLWDNSSHTWWSRIIEEENHPLVFAKLPFICMAPSAKSPVLAIGYVKPESTGEDESLWVIKAEEIFQPFSLKKTLKQSGIDYKIHGENRVFGTPNMNHYLVCISGFVSNGDEQIENFLEIANKHLREEINSNSLSECTPITAHYLGSYATPILFGK